MLKKDNYLFIALFLVFGAALGLLASILLEENIPLLMIIGGAIGLLIGTGLDLLINHNKEK